MVVGSSVVDSVGDDVVSGGADVSVAVLHVVLSVVSRPAVTSGDTGTLSVEVDALEVLASEVGCVAGLVSGLEGAAASSVVMSTAVVPVSTVVGVSETTADAGSGLKLVDTTVLFISVVSAITVVGNVFTIPSVAVTLSV